MSPERTDIITEPVLEGRLAAGKGETLADFDIAPQPLDSALQQR